MKITAIKITNVRGYKQIPETSLSKNINVFIGANNAGKSTILNSIFLLQRKSLDRSDITIGETKGYVELYFEGSHPPNIPVSSSYKKIVYDLNSANGVLQTLAGSTGHAVQKIPQEEPKNLIYPYLSKRKATAYVDVMNEVNANLVSGNFANLYSKIDRLSTPQFMPGNTQYVEACKSILGFEIATLAKGNGKQAVYFVQNLEHIPLTAMGDGVANILGLITDLCIAENKIFLIEEPENDIHPKALKSLLRLIIEKSKTNQFFVSTHSNIVMKYLGSVPESKLFNITNDLRDKVRENLFMSNIVEISENPEERRRILEDLGYDFFDFDLWKGWIFLEESSAETIIRDYLIDWFVKPLKNKVRTFSAGGVNNIAPKFDDFDKLFIFLHLEPTYKNRVWILIDGGEDEEKIINKMKTKYSKAGWTESNFNQLKEHDFEKYYPEEFNERVESILQIVDKQKRRDAKKELLDQVKDWISEDESSAKEKFRKSASEIIEHLKTINRNLNN